MDRGIFHRDTVGGATVEGERDGMMLTVKSPASSGMPESVPSSAS
jgi:hypothetical protein